MLFVVIAVLLSAAGVYGLMSYFTSQRAREIAIRMALGASPRDIQAMVLREITSFAIAACYLPAHKVARVDPVAALRA